MTDKKSRIEELISDLQQQRDELRLQMHLAQAEAKEEWEEIEKKWYTVENRLDDLREDAAESAGDIGAALGLVAEEIQNAYKRLRKRLD